MSTDSLCVLTACTCDQLTVWTDHELVCELVMLVGVANTVNKPRTLVTNQTDVFGTFDYLDAAEDSFGQPILHTDMSEELCSSIVCEKQEVLPDEVNRSMSNLHRHLVVLPALASTTGRPAGPLCCLVQ